MARFGLSHDKEKGFTRSLVNPLNLMGWLMGLEPTTTGITILTFSYSNVLMFVVIRININNLDYFNTKWQHQKLIDIFLN